MIETAKPSRWLIAALSDEHWFQNSAPKWRCLPTPSGTTIEQNNRAELLRLNGDDRLARILKACKPRSRCLSGACLQCGQAFQRFVAVTLASKASPPASYSLVSICAPPDIRPGELTSLSIIQLRRDLTNILRKAGALLAAGGINISLREFSASKRPSRWAPHFRMLVHKKNETRWRLKIRSHFTSYPSISRPVSISSWDGRVEALGCALETQFIRRVEIGVSRFSPGAHQQSRNTRNDRLRASERLELYRYLHQVGLESRLVLFNLAKTDGGIDVG